MAQYPQGIFQTIQWLLKKVKILALAKRPVYNLGVLTTTYNIDKAGIYYMTNATGSPAFAFPDPAMYQGQTVVISLPGAFSAAVISNAYTPLDSSGLPYATLNQQFTYEFISTGVKWVGGSLG